MQVEKQDENEKGVGVLRVERWGMVELLLDFLSLSSSLEFLTPLKCISTQVKRITVLLSTVSLAPVRARQL